MHEIGADPAPGSWSDALQALSRAALAAEDALFATVPVLGEPVGQRSLDAWVDQCVDVLRAAADLAEEILDRRSLLGLDQTGCEAQPDSPAQSATPALSASPALSGKRAQASATAEPGR